MLTLTSVTPHYVFIDLLNVRKIVRQKHTIYTFLACKAPISIQIHIVLDLILVAFQMLHFQIAIEPILINYDFL